MKYQTFEIDYNQLDKIRPEDKAQITKLNPGNKIARELEKLGYQFYMSESDYAGIPASVMIEARDDGSHVREFRKITTSLGIKYNLSYSFVGPWKT